MALPTGSGSEIIKSSHFSLVGATSGGTTSLITGVALHIYTVLSIIITNRTTRTNDTLNLGLLCHGGANNEDVYLLFAQSIGSKETFTWNDRFSFHGQGNNSAVQKLQFYTAGDNASQFDIHVTYIDQDWT